MTPWSARLMYALRDARSVDESFGAVADGARRLGFDSCAYGYEYPVPFSRNECFLVNNYASSWRERYREAGYVRVDPTVIRARVSTEPMVWSNRAFRGPAQMWDEARSFGLRHGWSQSCFSANGAVGLLSLARDNEPLTDVELLCKDPELRWLVNVAHASLSVFAFPAIQRRQRRLTRREIEVLRWAGDGKTAEETGAILRRSRNTVEWHLKNAMRKLGTHTRVATVGKAAALGLLR